MFIEQNLKTKEFQIHPTVIPFLTRMIVSKGTDGEEYLQPYIADVNHNTLNKAKVLNIMHTILGNPYHHDDNKYPQPQEMGSDTFILLGFANKVSFFIMFYCLSVI